MLAATAGVALLLGWAEVIHWRASWRRLGPTACPDGSEAVVVLGVRNRGARANYLNRFRVRAGVRSISPTARDSVLVLCGGAVAGPQTEADLMARYARDELGYDGPLHLDRDSQSTWENISNAIPLIEDADVIKIVSNSLHAERARVTCGRSGRTLPTVFSAARTTARPRSPWPRSSSASDTSGFAPAEHHDGTRRLRTGLRMSAGA